MITASRWDVSEGKLFSDTAGGSLAVHTENIVCCLIQQFHVYIFIPKIFDMFIKVYL